MKGKKRLPEVSEKGAGMLKVELGEAPCSTLALPPLLIKLMLVKKSHPCDPPAIFHYQAW